ncbi:DUF4123 domain-containing protein [Cystobacter fuscus]|uniref:DUF4123 domain-containing protein n=1 Tax=Cystobacter fuscus TaxID=43 RepID=UPI002B2CF5A4|nr:DUF4123 domain-containing protein [Cystobacter fuscus]
MNWTKNSPSLTASSLPSWMQVSAIDLEALRQEGRQGRLFAVLDACHTPQVLARVAELGEHRGRILYRGAAARNLAEQAPYLVHVDEELLAWIHSTLWTQPWGIFIQGALSFEDLFVHLRKFLTVDSPHGERWFFRYYDPRVLPAFLAACSDEEANDFLGPVQAFSILGAGMEGLRLERVSHFRGSAAARTRAVGTRFRLREPHLTALQPLAHPHSSDRLLQGLRERGHAFKREPATGDLVGSDALGYSTRLTLGADHMPQRLLTPAGTLFQFENDARGQVKTLILPGGARLSLKRDTKNRLTEAGQEGEIPYRFGYDEQDRLLHITYPDGTYESLDYTEDGKVAARRDRAGALRRYSYNSRGHLEACANPLGRRTALEVDEEGRLASITHPDGSRESFVYDPSSRKATQTTRDGRTVTRQLNANGHLEEIRWADGSSVRLEITPSGRLDAASNAQAHTAYTYDAEDRLRSEHTGEAGFTYEYDKAGRLIALTSSRGTTVRYEYDPDGKPLCVRAWGKTISLEYEASGAIQRLRYGAAVIEEQEHARFGRRSHSRVTDGNNHCLSEQRYIYDACERLVVLYDRQSPEAWLERSFTYDQGSRLVSERVQQGNQSQQSIHHAYDANGNLILDGSVRRQFGPMDEPRNHGDFRIEYDALGQVTRLPGPHGELECRHNADGTLGELQASGVRWNYTYDALGRRITATDGQRTWRYGWSGLQLMWEELCEAPDTPPARREYVYLPQGVSPIAFHEAGQTYWMQQDARHAVIAVFDDEGRLAWRARYDSFGKAHIDVGRVRQPWRLAGQYEDEGTGLHYNLGRYYSPLLKSYLSRDPAWFKEGATGYSYCANDPWNHIDPHAQWAWIAAGAIIGAVVGGVVAALEGKSPMQIAAAALEGAVTGAAFAVNPFLGAAVFAAADILHQGLENGWSNICISCALLKAAIVLAGGWVLGHAMGFVARRIVRAVNGAKLAASVGKWIPRWALRPWKLPPSVRGFFIEGHLQGNLPYGFKVFDKFNRATGVATSIKSCNLFAKTYQKPGNLDRLLKGYINKMRNFAGDSKGGVTILPGDATTRVLQVAVPKGAATPAQQQVLNNAIQHAQSQSRPGLRIIMEIIEIP